MILMLVWVFLLVDIRIIDWQGFVSMHTSMLAYHLSPITHLTLRDDLFDNPSALLRFNVIMGLNLCRLHRLD